MLVERSVDSGWQDGSRITSSCRGTNSSIWRLPVSLLVVVVVATTTSGVVIQIVSTNKRPVTWYTIKQGPVLQQRGGAPSKRPSA